MKILYICPTDPRETAYGGQQRTHVIWKGLQVAGEVWTVVPVPHKRMEERNEQDRIYKVCLERRYTLGWFAQRLLLRFFPQLAFPLGPKRDALSAVLANPDVCIARTLWVAARFGMWKLAPLFVDVDDTPTVDFALANPNSRFKLWLLQKWQNWICAKAKVLWVPDPEQVEGLKPFKATHLPNIPIGDISPVDRSKVDTNRLLFLGYLAHRPNIVALDWFLENLWRELKKRVPNLKLDVVGGGLPEEHKVKWSTFQDVEMHGFVQDVAPFFERSLALVTPMKIGSGTCIKVLESLARGVPVVSTEQGLRGIDRKEWSPENGIIPFSDPNSLCEGLAKCPSSARTELIKRAYSQSVVVQKFQQDLLSVGDRK